MLWGHLAGPCEEKRQNETLIVSKWDTHGTLIYKVYFFLKTGAFGAPVKHLSNLKLRFSQLSVNSKMSRHFIANMTHNVIITLNHYWWLFWNVMSLNIYLKYILKYLTKPHTYLDISEIFLETQGQTPCKYATDHKGSTDHWLRNPDLETNSFKHMYSPKRKKILLIKEYLSYFLCIFCHI